jgi:hypothetical protein
MNREEQWPASRADGRLLAAIDAQIRRIEESGLIAQAALLDWIGGRFRQALIFSIAFSGRRPAITSGGFEQAGRTFDRTDGGVRWRTAVELHLRR